MDGEFHCWAFICLGDRYGIGRENTQEFRKALEKQISTFHAYTFE
jgi:hypothetical protein